MNWHHAENVRAGLDENAAYSSFSPLSLAIYLKPRELFGIIFILGEALHTSVYPAGYFHLRYAFFYPVFIHRLPSGTYYLAHARELC